MAPSVQINSFLNDFRLCFIYQNIVLIIVLSDADYNISLRKYTLLMLLKRCTRTFEKHLYKQFKRSFKRPLKAFLSDTRFFKLLQTFFVYSSTI